ncbi:hypothetical protein DFS34DRAFT_610794 [Phlyctochytrium arcticum]|nr:hypothetical protein DFS34DRAFT_610794 [Phlyctochytrium arcticum]
MATGHSSTGAATTAGNNNPLAFTSGENNDRRQGRPLLNSRACSYQDTSRYRTSTTFTKPDNHAKDPSSSDTLQTFTLPSTLPPPPPSDLQRTNSKDDLVSLASTAVGVGSHSSWDSISKAYSSRTATPSASVRGPPAPVHHNHSYQYTSAQQYLQAHHPASGGTPGTTTPSSLVRPSPFIPGFFVPSVTSLNGGTQTPPPILTGPTTPGAGGILAGGSIWGPASPSLSGSFNFTTDRPTPSQLPGVQIQSTSTSTPSAFAFTIHADRSLSADSRPGTPESLDSADVLKKKAVHVEPTDRTVMIAVDAADQEGLLTLDWACENVVKSGDAIVILRVVREQKGFKGGYKSASDMLSTIESRAREEADRVTCHALRQLGKSGKKCVDVVVKYRVGEPRRIIREVVQEEQPGVLVVGNGRKRLSGAFFHTAEGGFVPQGMEVEVVEARR